MGQIKTPGLKPAVITLKAVAQHIGLTPGTGIWSSERFAVGSFHSARDQEPNPCGRQGTDYPNEFFRPHSAQQTHLTIGSHRGRDWRSDSSPIISGIEQYLRQRDYFFLTVVHRHDPVLLNRYLETLLEREWRASSPRGHDRDQAPLLPTVAIAGHKKLKGVTSIILDHEHAAVLALTQLQGSISPAHRFYEGIPFEFGREGSMGRDLRGAADWHED